MKRVVTHTHTHTLSLFITHTHTTHTLSLSQVQIKEREKMKRVEEGEDQALLEMNSRKNLVHLQPTNQPINQSSKQTTKQPTNQPSNRPKKKGKREASFFSEINSRTSLVTARPSQAQPAHASEALVCLEMNSPKNLVPLPSPRFDSHESQLRDCGRWLSSPSGLDMLHGNAHLACNRPFVMQFGVRPIYAAQPVGVSALGMHAL